MNEFVEYLNSTNNIGGNSTGSLAEAQVKSPYFDAVKIDRKIGKRITNEIQQGDYRAYILTGHAGDGKTSILVQVLKSLGLLEDGEGLSVSKEYEQLFYVKDMSEVSEQDQVRNLRRALSAPNDGKTSILISNTGPLLNAFLALAEIEKQETESELSEEERIELQSKLLTQLDRNADKEIEIGEYSFVLVNIARVDNVSFAKDILKKIVAEELWEKCSDCPSASKCPILHNRNLLFNHYDRVGDFIDNYYRFLYENDKRMTIRQMIGQISYGITGNLTCKKIKIAMLKSPLFTYNFANLFFGYKGLTVEKEASQIRGIQLIRELGIDAIALNVDYNLFVNHNYSYFPVSVRGLIEDLTNKSRKFFQVVEDENGQNADQEKNAEFRKAVRRFYLLYGIPADNETIEDLYNQILGSNFVDYKKLITSAQPTSMKRKIQGVVYKALYIKNTGFLPPSNTDMLLPLTLRREDDVYQSVLLVLGEVNKTDIKIETQKISNKLEDMDEKYELFIKLRDSKYKLTLPMLKYFNDLIDGSVRSNNNPALTHGIASLDTLLLEKFGNDYTASEDCEISVIVNTTYGQKIKRYDFDRDHVVVID